MRVLTAVFLYTFSLFPGLSWAQNRPNILLIISDDLNTRIGPYMDLPAHTPNLTRLADEGVRFSNAYCQFPLCGPSRASLMSGLYPATNGVFTNQHVKGSYRGSNPDLAEHPTMAGFFREQGYFTARVSKIFHMGVPGGIERGEAGDDDPDSWDFATNIMGPETLSSGELELLSPKNPHYGGNFAQMILPDQFAPTQTDYLATSQAIAILESRAAKVAAGATNKVKIKPQEPFFLAVGLVRPHVPLIAPERCFAPYPAKEMELPEAVVGENVPKPALRLQNDNIWGMSEEQQRKAISGYMASVRFMDEQVGRLLATLDRLELRKETIVAFISDHGYNLGEHDCWSKVSLWEGSVRVPMIISEPKNAQKHGTVCPSLTELIDLYPTLAGLADLTEKQPEILQGKSFAPYLLGKSDAPEKTYAYTVSGQGKHGTIRTKRWRYTRWNEQAEVGMEELYDHQNDPEEHVNLVDDPDFKNTLAEMRELFASVQEQAKGK